MSGPTPDHWPWLRSLPRAACVTAWSVAALALAGWTLGIASLRAVAPGLMAMNPLAAVAFLVAAAGLWLELGRTAPRHAVGQDRQQRIVQACGAVVALIGLINLGDQLLSWDLGMDHVLFRAQLLSMNPPNRMAPNAGLCFALIGAGLVAQNARVARVGAASLTVAPVALLSVLAIIGYAYGTRTFYGVSRHIPMALNTALAFLALSVGLFLARPTPLLTRLTASTGAGASVRRLLPAALLIPIVLGWIRLQGERLGVYDSAFGTALFAVMTMVLFALLVTWNNRAQHQAEAALQESERRLFQILEAMPVGVFVLDAAGQAYYANRTSQAILGKGLAAGASHERLPDVYGAYVAGTSTLYPPERQPIARALCGERAYTADIEIHGPDRVTPIEVWAAPVYDREDRLAFAIAAFNDITERQHAQAQIDTLNAELKRQVGELEVVNRELEAFSYSVSHDLRAPLRAIDGFSRMLVEDHGSALDAEARRLLAVIRDSARRMGRLIDDLLDFSRLSRKELNAAPIDMTALARAACADLTKGTSHQRAELDIASLPPARGDATLLQQVWANLISNALKYSGKRPDPRVVIGGGREGAELVYYVRDNGVGFDMAYAQKLFGVFQRLHRPEEFDGTGVGLAIVQRVIQRHGGRVWFESEPERGATFSFALPAGE